MPSVSGILPEFSKHRPLYLILNGSLLFGCWDAIWTERAKQINSSVPKDLIASAFATLIDVTRVCHFSASQPSVTNLAICYALLEKACLFRLSESASVLSQQGSKYSTLLEFYSKVQDLCGGHIITRLNNGEVQVVGSSNSITEYQITILSETDKHEK